LASSFLNAAYFVPIIYKAFFREEDSEAKGHENKSVKEIPLMVVPLTLTAIVSVVLGLYPDFIVQIAESVIR
jgi:multicomponent Na+:H+ antiporter subunit D